MGVEWHGHCLEVVNHFLKTVKKQCFLYNYLNNNTPWTYLNQFVMLSGWERLLSGDYYCKIISLNVA